MTYMVSAVLMWLVGGEWTVVKETLTSRNPFQLIITFKNLTVEGVQYLSSCSFSILVLLKSSGSLTFGSTDVLNVQLSRVVGDETGDNKRLGILFAMMGLGCFIGPIGAERCISMKKPRSILASCVISLGILSFGFSGMGFSSSFQSICFFMAVRGGASSVIWINSTLLLQKFSRKDMLGRVFSVDLTFCTLCISLSSFIAGALEDNAGMRPEDVCIIMAGMGFIIFLAWGYYFLNYNDSF